MATPADREPSKPVDETGTEAEQLTRLKRYDQRVEEWLTSLKEEAGQRSPEVLSALAAKAKDVGDYLDKMAEKARSRNDASGPSPEVSRSGDRSAVAGQVQEDPGDYRGPDPEADPKGDGAQEDQGT